MKQLYLYSLNNMVMLLMVLIFSMISVAFLTLFERKILSYMHYRKGPNKVGYWGLFQPFSDAMKLLSKEYFYSLKSNYYFYYFSPIIMFSLIMSMWMIYPFKMNLFNWNLSSLFFLCLMSMGVYGLMLSGWSSNSSFSLLGSIRSISQSISYEVTFTISFLMIFLMINSLNFFNLMVFQKYFWMIIVMWPSSMIMLISMIAEINRTPFDLSEGESELVSGFNVEYSSHSFVLIFLAEYSSIILMMFIFNFLYFFFNMMNFFFYLNLMMWLFLIIWIRVTLPRIRYDYLMFFCWIYILPMILILFYLYMLYIKFMIFLMLN
uniref:NADH-ubiquinone oxidoreductase chain 1 n=1 Tax=Pseudognaptodon sp. QL-2014 TaxID=1491725 RepID=A0A0U1WH33_9HYME|nr:NADH dehydrogenase subunit 1 [Pseudognaptodon sp. QL-2014]